MPRRFILAPANTELTPPTTRRNFLSRVFAFAAGGAMLARAPRALAAPSATEGANPFVGEIAIVPFNFAPVGWALCDGSLLLISQNQALFALIGTYYGGNGTTTFALPDLRGRMPLGMGNGPVGNYVIGQLAGESAHVLTTVEMPQHSHGLNGIAANGTSDSPAGLLPARNPAGIPAYGSGTTAGMNAAAIAASGSGQPHNNMPPYLALNFIIALQGIFPSRS
jgi:microcystin-dependent protein